MSSNSELYKDLPLFKDPRSEAERLKGPSDLSTKKSLLSANRFLSNQIEKNKKYIKSLQSILAWISSCSGSINPELTSLMLANPSNEETYDFELHLISDFNKYICKSKYFSIIIELRPLTGRIIPSHERINLEAKLYSSDPIPKHLVHTMQGKPIVRGRGTEMMVFHPSENKFLARIKMQITEVSSHFINGYINLVVSKKNDVHYSIKPLVLKELIVKAKEKTCKRWREQNS
ncbi:hypothetical protein SteCoe_15648 [Stentor coeruleus]|uniref:Uncharacterized protein n=1 Tax=Stentor coeruleus TaxID=5963 RepID=A0A1R2C341_9CILI|nr:hypothetical protein SteCoe_15648 [Stentor coeruleus]